MIEEQEREDLTATLRAGTIVGIVVEVLLTVQFTMSSAFYAVHGFPIASFAPYYPQPSPYPVLASAFFPVAYTVGFKHWLKSKRTVNPATIFFGAFLIDLILGADYVIRAPPYYINGLLVSNLVLTAQWQLFAEFTIAVMVLVVMLAAFSVAGARIALGLYIEGVDRKTYHIDLQHNVVFNAFKSGRSSSQYLMRFNELGQDKNAIVLKRRYPTGDEVILAIGYNPDRPEQGTTIATAAYSKNAYGIYRSERASSTRDSVVYDLVGRCHYGKEPIEKTKEDELTDFASSRVYEVAVAPARSPLSAAKDIFLELDRYYQVAIVSTLLAMVVVVVAASQNIGTGQAGDILTILFALMVGEIGVAIYQERKGRKEPLTWELSVKGAA